MALSIGALARIDTGIDTGAFTVRLHMPRPAYRDPVRQRAFADELIERVAVVGGLHAAALADRTPIPTSWTGNSAFNVEVAGAASPQPIGAHRHVIAGAYFDTVGLALISGRTFDRRDAEGVPEVAIINDALAERLWPGEPAVGRDLRVSHDDSRVTVVGVVANVARAWNDPRPAHSVYVPHAQSPRERMTVFVRTAGNQPAPADDLRGAIHAIDPGVVVFAPESIEAGIAAQTAPTRALSNMIGWMAFAALLVCLSGIYALVSHAAGRRTREVGVRMALGANADQVVRLLVGQGLKTSGLGLLIGLLLAAALTNFLLASTQGLVTIDARVFALLAAGMLLLAAAASWLPARRAARVDPASTLRAD
jgi:putative ABC transport system permease protein